MIVFLLYKRDNVMGNKVGNKAGNKVGNKAEIIALP